jgi:NTP pyrophosphatase (non-canonical NTP hydrolase)
MTSSEYVKIVEKTAIYPNKIITVPYYSGADYAKLGLIGEYGEICNKLKKVYRDNEGNYSSETILALTKEIGDVYWYIAALCNKEFNISFVACYETAKKMSQSNESYLFTNIYRGIYYASQICFPADPDHVEANVTLLLNCLESINKYLGLRTENILEINYEKLSQRLEANTIKGDGDNR